MKKLRARIHTNHFTMRSEDLTALSNHKYQIQTILSMNAYKEILLSPFALS